jgi:putative oxidoreductase
MMGYLSKVETKIQNISFKLDPLLRLIPRLLIGMVFIPAGWGKLQNLNHTIEYFRTLNIPLASVQAPMAALSEVTFGICVLVGLFTRLATLPLFLIMMVALFTAHKSDIPDVYALIELAPALYAVVLICIFTMGAGPLSLDQMLFRRK